MITTGAVNEDLIAQFKNDIEDFDCVTRVSRQNGRAINVQVEKNENGVPYPYRELGESKDGNIVADDYAISRLAGSGHAPGDKYTHCLAVSPLCSECGEKPQKGLDDDDDRCSDCAFGDNLLSAEPGTTVTVEVAEDPFGARLEEGEQIKATADEDGLLRDHEEDRVFNDGRYRIVEIVETPHDDDDDDDENDPRIATDGGTTTDRKTTTDEDRSDESDKSDKPDESAESDEDLTKIEMGDLTEREMEEIIPERPYVVIGYRSNRSEADILEQEIQNPKQKGSEGWRQHQVRSADIVGSDPNDESRGVGFTRGTTQSSGSTLGSTAYVKIPDYDPIEKVDYTVRFRVHEGRYSTQSSDEGVIEGVTEIHNYDHQPYRLDTSNANAYEWEVKDDWFVKRAAFDLLVDLTLPATDDEETVIEKAKENLPSTAWEENIPPIGEHIEERAPMQGGDRNLRNQRFITNATIDKATKNEQ